LPDNRDDAAGIAHTQRPAARHGAADLLVIALLHRGCGEVPPGPDAVPVTLHLPPAQFADLTEASLQVQATRKTLQAGFIIRCHRQCTAHPLLSTGRLAGIELQQAAVVVGHGEVTAHLYRLRVALPRRLALSEAG